MQIQKVREVAEEFQSEHPEIAQDTLPIFGLFWSRIGQRLMSRNERRRVNLQGFDRSGCLFCSIRRQLQHLGPHFFASPEFHDSPRRDRYVNFWLFGIAAVTSLGNSHVE